MSREALATVVIVYGRQGVIDNGGFRYFFEPDFPRKPSYAVFVEAYRRIGAADAAEAIQEAVALFPFADPHLHVEDRNAFLDSLESRPGDPSILRPRARGSVADRSRGQGLRV